MATVATAPGRGPFVGRAAELAELRELVTAASARSGGLVLISGPAGIGKTRLVEEALRGVPCVVWGRAVDDPGAPPLWPWRRVMRSRPEVAAAVADALAEVDLVRERSADPEAARFRLVAAATDALLAVAEADGLVVVLEDLHWADETSLRLLRHLAGELQGSRLLVVGTYRDPAAAAGEGRLDRALPELLRWSATQAIGLRPLGEDDVRAYLAAVAPLAGDDVLRVHRRCGGNPLYLRALARLPTSPDGSPEEVGTVAGSELRHLVRTTVAALDGEVIELLATAAVLGEEVDPTVLADVSGRTSDEVGAALDSAVRAGVLAAVPDAPGRRRFVHAVVRDGIYADLEPSVREALHRRAAEAWETSIGTDEAAAGIVAGHWARAAVDPAALHKAASWARRASDAATRSLAFDEAARYLTMALEALDRAGADQAARAALLVDLATAELRAGRVVQSLEHATAASDAAVAANRPDLLAEAALAVHDVAAPGFPAALIRMCERALATPDEARPAAVRARLLAQLASALADSGRLGLAAERATEAVALAEAGADPEAVIDAVRARVKASPAVLEPAEKLRLGRLAVVRAETAHQPLAALWGHKWRIDAELEVGDMAALADELARVQELARSTRLPLIRWHDLRLRASVAALFGRFPEARALNEQAKVVGATELRQDPSTAGMSGVFDVQHALVTGEQPRWDDAVMDHLRRADATPVVVVTRVLVALLRRGREEAAEPYERLRAPAADRDFVTGSGVAINMVPLVEAFGDRETARRLEETIAAHPFAAGGAGVYGCGSVAGILGRLAVVLGRSELAVSRFEEALAVDTGTGARPATVHDRVGLAGALLDRGRAEDAERAQQLARVALAEARRLDMPGPARTASALLNRARTATRAADPLTPREREIAGLVSRALTNRQIAERLYLSERTVESHVRNILAKLGVANRTEIAVEARRMQ